MTPTHSPLAVVPVILCGGSGTRLWPLSRSGFPKQFLVLCGNQSLFQQAVARVNGLAAADISVADTLVVTNEEHRFLALDQLRELSQIKAQLLLEPEARNTAPALTLAALQAQADGNDPILVVVPADQTILDDKAFTTAMQNAVRTAADDAIVILGVKPDNPQTGYGYIQHHHDTGLYGDCQVLAFAEKPDLDTAKSYLAQGDYAWNAGIFVLRASVWLDALQLFSPHTLQVVSDAWANRAIDHHHDAQFIRPHLQQFNKAIADSVDYAVLEHCPGTDIDIRMVPLDAKWNDLGAWDAVWRVGEQDTEGNVAIGDALLTQTANSMIHASSRLVAMVGVKDLIVVETSDAVLVAHRSESQHVKNIVTQLQNKQRDEHNQPRKVHRPWGWYDSIETGERFKVKRIQVKPGASLSLQKHAHRAEHWVVVKGSATVTCENQILTLQENQSTFIPQGAMHRLANHGTEPLEIIEIQSGSYLGEDDIIRFEDSYGR
jgi:mannose-1-phosphate guanylyltransferase / mannose-6-phosphate isomerase